MALHALQFLINICIDKNNDYHVYDMDTITLKCIVQWVSLLLFNTTPSQSARKCHTTLYLCAQWSQPLHSSSSEMKMGGEQEMSCNPSHHNSQSKKDIQKF